MYPIINDVLSLRKDMSNIPKNFTAEGALDQWTDYVNTRQKSKVSAMAFSSFNRIFARNFATAAEKSEKGDATRLWRNLYIFVGFPATLLGALNCYLNSGHHPKPEFIPYEHLRIRTRRFPWGDGQQSLFHNPHVNALPTGYEE
ncbi:hypothetical protein V1477_002997 [Vespula maculifrons]|uniref:Cytochrome c oxidase subunit n=1 Tax=Vespula maculifrons TaxID=7453 RepID=A0ABD2CUB3_VESMC